MVKMSEENMSSWDNVKGPVVMIVGGIGLAILISVCLVIYG